MSAEEPVVPGEPAAPVAEQWSTLLWDDPVSLQSYVVHVLQRRCPISRERAVELMHLAERDGSTPVAQGPREEQEMLVAALHTDGLLATLERCDS